MKAGRALLVLPLFCAFATVTAAQAPRPRPRPAPAPPRPSPAPARTGTLVVETDLACELSVDGDSKGVLEIGRVARLDLAPGEHLARCGATSDPDVVWRQTVTVAVGSSKATLIELKAILDAKREAAERRAVELRHQAQEEAAAARARAEAEERRRFEEAEARKTPQERANDVLRRAVEAMGGLDRIRKIQTISMQRVSEDGQTTYSLRLPGTVRIESTGARPFLQMYNEGTRSGMIRSIVESFPASLSTNFRAWSPTPAEARSFFPFFLADLIDTGMTYIGVSAGVVELERVMPGQFGGSSFVVKYRFSANSGLLEEVGPTRLSDYRDVQGLKVPFLNTSTVPRFEPNGRGAGTPTVRMNRVVSIELDRPLPDSLFVVPAYTPTPSPVFPVPPPLPRR